MRFTNIIAIAAILISAASCTDVITVDIEEVPPQLVVDAWIDNEPGPQSIRLTLSQGYFNNTFTPTVNDASVAVTNSEGDIFIFGYEGEGLYVWRPSGNETLGDIGETLFLGVEWNGNVFGSQSEIYRVPPIDSIVSEFREKDIGAPEGYYAQFYSRDLTGFGDTYWIKSYKNGQYLNKGFELNIAYDAGFAPGAQTDGLVFLPPIREGVNRVPDPDTEDDGDVPPWAPGDSLRVEIHSISNLGFEFLRIARDQINNGSNTIFAIPIANARSNILTLEGDETALGFFNVAAISRMEVEIEEE